MEDLTLEQANESNENIDDEEEEKNKSHDDAEENGNEKEKENKINIIEMEEEKEEDPIEKEKTKIRLLLKAANDDMTEKNYKNAEEKFRLIYEAKDKNDMKEITEQITDILYNFSLCLYYQMKYEEATKYLYEIIVNYDNKSKKAYLLLLQILYDINEYNRAKLLIAKIYKMFDNENDLNEFKEIDKEVDSCIKRNNNNIKRQFYYNAEKEIVKFRKSLEFFYWCFYSICALVAGHYLSKLL
jgi:tetratricopeptide (TPR) repeat protein